MLYNLHRHHDSLRWHRNCVVNATLQRVLGSRGFFPRKPPGAIFRTEIKKMAISGAAAANQRENEVVEFGRHFEARYYLSSGRKSLLNGRAPDRERECPPFRGRIARGASRIVLHPRCRSPLAARSLGLLGEDEGTRYEMTRDETGVHCVAP